MVSHVLTHYLWFQGPAHGSASSHPQPHGVGTCSCCCVATFTVMPALRSTQLPKIRTKMTVGVPMWRCWHWPTCYKLMCMRMFPSMVHGTSMVQPMWKHTAMYFQSPCTSDILLTTLMWSALFETPSDLTLSGLLPICLVCGTSHMHAVLTRVDTHTSVSVDRVRRRAILCRLDPQWTHTLL